MLLIDFPLEILLIIVSLVCENDKRNILLFRILNKTFLSITKIFLKLKFREREKQKFVFSNKKFRKSIKKICDFIYCSTSNNECLDNLIGNYSRYPLQNNLNIIINDCNNEPAHSLTILCQNKSNIKIEKLGKPCEIKNFHVRHYCYFERLTFRNFRFLKCFKYSLRSSIYFKDCLFDKGWLICGNAFYFINCEFRKRIKFFKNYKTINDYKIEIEGFYFECTNDM